MNTITLMPMTIAGFSIRTTNENQQSIKDQGGLWRRFFMEKPAVTLGDIIIDPTKIYGLYYDYESDFMKPYSFLAGFQIVPGSMVPKGMTAVAVPAREYSVFETIDADDIPTRIGEVWIRIWHSNAKRSYGHDLEVYAYGDSPKPKVAVFIS
jgi:predicted transcriptional regulator YdeE